LDPTSSPPAVTDLSPAVPDVDISTPGPIFGISTPAITTPFGSPDLRPADMFEDMDMDVSPYEDAPLTRTRDSTPNTDTEEAPAADTEASVVTVPIPAATRPVRMPSTTDPIFRSPSPVSLDTIDEASVPDFLIHHGKGKREVNIFDYLNKVDDPHFQRVLFHYLHFEINDKSGRSTWFSYYFPYVVG